MTHIIITDLGYGDAGKGSVVDWLCSRPARRPVRSVIRFNGGAQAAHHVVTPDGRQHSFAQFGAGTFTPGVRTHLSRFFLVDPLALAAEAAQLASLGVPDPLSLVTVDGDALLTTPYHQAANRSRELARGTGRHGSCGMGIGETASYALAHPEDAPRAADCTAPQTLTRKLARLQEALSSELGPLAVPPAADVCDAYRAFADKVQLTDAAFLARLLRTGPAVFEGAQGVLLDEWRGFHPYTTWSTTTFANAEALLAEAGQTGTRLGVIRCYMTRHGPGPFVTEDPTLELADAHNQTNPWQGPFRVGHLDGVALRYAIEAAGGVHAIALSHLDVAARRPDLKICRGYQIEDRVLTRLTPGPPRDLEYQERLTAMLLRARPVYDDPGDDWPAVIEHETGAPVRLRSYGPTALDKQTSRAWASTRTTS